jgi:hypothetical protein
MHVVCASPGGTAPFGAPTGALYFLPEDMNRFGQSEGGFKMYKKVATDMGFVEREKEVLAFWQDQGIFKKTIEQRDGCPTFGFYGGPSDRQRETAYPSY